MIVSISQHSHQTEEANEGLIRQTKEGVQNKGEADGVCILTVRVLSQLSTAL